MIKSEFSVVEDLSPQYGGAVKVHFDTHTIIFSGYTIKSIDLKSELNSTTSLSDIYGKVVLLYEDNLRRLYIITKPNKIFPLTDIFTYKEIKYLVHNPGTFEAFPDFQLLKEFINL